MDQPGGATLHIYRRPAYSSAAVPFSVRVDGFEVAKVRPNERVAVPVAPGQHRIQLSMWSRQGSQTLTFVADAGQQLGFVCQGTLKPLHPIDLERDDTIAGGASASQHPAPQYAASHYPPQQYPTPPVAAPADWSAAARVELIETDQYDEPLGEEVRVIDNQHSTTGVIRNVRASREWTRSVSIGSDRSRTYGAEAGGGPSWLSVKGHIEQQLHRTYSAESQEKQVFAEEIQITVPAWTSVRVVLRWKRIWQRGIARVIQGDGSLVEVPFQVVVNVTFDQSQQDVGGGGGGPAPMNMDAPGYWKPASDSDAPKR